MDRWYDQRLSTSMSVYQWYDGEAMYSNMDIGKLTAGES
jgi:hypothetical protein